MKRVQLMGTAVLTLLLGAPGVSHAQGRAQDRQGDGIFQRGVPQSGERRSGGRQGAGSEAAGRQRGDRGSYSRTPGNRPGGEGQVRERPRSVPEAGRIGRDRAGNDRQGADRPSRSVPGGTDRTGPNRGTYDRSTPTRGSYDRSTPSRGSYDRSTPSRGTYDRSTPSRGSYERGGTNRGSYDRGSSNRGSYDRRYDGRGSSGRSGLGTSWNRYRARNFLSERRTWRQRGGYRGYRIPNTRFHSHFGRNRWFRANTLQFVFVSGRPYFDYDDYRFTFMDPYPEYWGDDWYDTDDVYIDYHDGYGDGYGGGYDDGYGGGYGHDDGYYLYNRRFPDRPGVAISISLRF